MVTQIAKIVKNLHSWENTKKYNKNTTFFQNIAKILLDRRDKILYNNLAIIIFSQFLILK
jgi:hypothetical protein